MNAQIKDSINLLKKITFKKAINGLRLVTDFYWSKYTGKVRYTAMPISISVEPTTSCNLRCPQCPSGLRSFSRPTGMLESSFYKKTIDELESTLLYLILYFQGEPYLNADFLEMVKYAHQKKIYTATSTNAHYLDSENARKTVESGLDRIIISIDGTSQEAYEQYRVGGKLDKVIEGTKNLIHWKKELKSSTPFVIFQFLVMKPNQHQIDEIKQLTKDIGVDHLFLKTAQIYDFEHGSALIPDLPDYARYEAQADGKYSIKNKLLNSCWKMWHSCVITWDGKVVPCCFDKDATHQLGDLKQDSFISLWNSDRYNAFRASLLRSRKEIDICTNCSEGTKVFS